MKKHFNKNLIMIEEEEEEQVWSSSTCWICEKIIDNGFFFLDKILVVIASMQFMNSSLEKLIKNFSNNDFKYLTEELGSKNLELWKRKDAYPYE